MEFSSQVKIGIIIPVYKIPAYMLNECYESLINQTYQNFEVVFIDDASPDDCGKLCDRFATIDERFSVIHKETNSGVSAARNTGIECIKCDYVMFVDGDDWLDLNLLELLVDSISSCAKRPDIVIFQQSMAYLKKSVKTELYPLENVWDTPEKRENLQIRAISSALKGTEDRVVAVDNVAGKLISYALLKTSNIRFQAIPYREDGLFFQEIVEEADTIIEVPVGYYYYRMRKGSAVNRFRKDAPEEMIRLSRIMFDFAKKNNKSNAYYNALYSFLLIPIQMSIVCFFYHPDNDKSLFRKHDECRIYLKQEPYCGFFTNIHLNQLKMNSRIKAVLLKLKLYGFIAWLRNLYLKSRSFIPYD